MELLTKQVCLTFFCTGDAFNDPLTKASYQSYCLCMRLSLMSAYDVMQAFKTLNIHCFQIASNSCIYAAGYWCVCACVCACVCVCVLMQVCWSVSEGVCVCERE